MKKTFSKTIIQLVLCLLIITKLSAQEKLHYWRDSETYLQDQATVIIDEAYRVLAAHPPGTSASNERKLALFSLDALLHDTRLDNGPAFMKYMDNMAANIATEIQNSKPVGSEILFFRFYNDGFIIKTPSITVAIDLIRGGKADNPFVSDARMRAIVDQCDIMFITHAHGDHTDLSVAEMFFKQGKTVVVPEEFWKDIPQLRVMRGTDVIRETVNVLAKNTSLKVAVYPGYQGNVLNNVYHITFPEGQTIVHTGDQDYNEDLALKIGQSKVDVLLVQCWMMPMEKFVSGVKPSLVICGHENEMGHTIDHREAYWLTFRRMSEVKVPYIVMAWGEHVKYIP